MPRLQAFCVHIFASITLAGISALVVFFLWYPSVLAEASGVNTIFLLLITVDVVIGPVITFIIFNRQKKELRRDLATVGALQLAALFYGLHAVYIARPAFIVFNANRFDLVYANEISDKNLAKAKSSEFKTIPPWGPKLVAAQLPSDTKAAKEIISSAVSGGDDVQHMPELYASYSKFIDYVKSKIRPIVELENNNPGRKAEIDKMIKKYTETKINIGFIPLKANTKDLVAILDMETCDLLELSDLRPFAEINKLYTYKKSDATQSKQSGLENRKDQ